MGLIQKEKRKYMEGMKFALKIATLYGVDDLAKEIKLREEGSIPLNVDHHELTLLAREQCKEELAIVATAMADTMVQDMKLPPSVIVNFLRSFNDKCDLYRVDKEEFQKAKIRLDQCYSLNKTVEKFMEE